VIQTAPLGTSIPYKRDVRHGQRIEALHALLWQLIGYIRHSHITEEKKRRSLSEKDDHAKRTKWRLGAKKTPQNCKSKKGGARLEELLKTMAIIREGFMHACRKMRYLKDSNSFGIDSCPSIPHPAHKSPL
jgi:hypothetical protein